MILGLVPLIQVIDSCREIDYSEAVVWSNAYSGRGSGLVVKTAISFRESSAAVPSLEFFATTIKL